MANKHNQADSYFYTWTLENIPFIIQTYKKSVVVKSSEFEIKMIGQDSKLLSTKWHLEFSLAYTDSICVVNLWHSSKSEVTVGVKGTFQFSLGTKLTWESIPFDVSKGDCFVFLHFFLEDLLAKPEEYLVNNNLELKFEMNLLPLAGVTTSVFSRRSKGGSVCPALADVNASAWDRQAWNSLKAGGLQYR